MIAQRVRYNRLTMTAPPCATCGAPMRWYAEYAGWGCDRCRQFHPAAAAPRSRTALYLGLGGGALVLLVVIVLAATGGSGDDSGTGSRKRSSRGGGFGGATYGFKGDSIEDAVDAMRNFRDRMCDCRTETCADRVERDYKAFERAMEKKFSSREIEQLLEDKRLVAKVERLDEERKKCRDKARRGDMSEMLDAYERYADRACACRDSDCTRRVTDEMTRDAQKWAKNASSTSSMTPEATKRLEATMKRFTECMVKVASTTATVPDP